VLILPFALEDYENMPAQTAQQKTRIAVFCGSFNGVDETLLQEAQSFGQACADHNLEIIYGGGSHGMMGACAQAAQQAGGSVMTIIPQKLVASSGEVANGDNDIICETMSERKDLMIEKSDVFAILPGGIGTIDEMIEVMTLNQIGFIDKKIILINKLGFWDGFVALIEDLVAKGFSGQNVRDQLILFPDTQTAFQQKEKWL